VNSEQPEGAEQAGNRNFAVYKTRISWRLSTWIQLDCG